MVEKSKTKEAASRAPCTISYVLRGQRLLSDVSFLAPRTANALLEASEMQTSNMRLSKAHVTRDSTGATT